MAEDQHGPSDKLKVFISYSRTDSDFADKLVTALEACGLEVLIDRRNLPLATEFQKELLGFIRQADSIVYVVSQASIRSPWCVWEIEQVQALNKRLAPVVIEPLDNVKVPDGISKINYVYFDGTYATDAGFVSQSDALANALKTDVEWIKEHTRIGERARLWQERKRPNALLFRDIEITEAESWSARRPLHAPALTQLQQDFLTNSRLHAAKVQRYWFAGAASIAAMAIGLSLIAYVQKNAAREQRDTALLTQSRFLTDQANRLLAEGNASKALAVALEALPRDLNQPERPVLPAAEEAMAKALMALKENRSINKHAIPKKATLEFNRDFSVYTVDTAQNFLGLEADTIAPDNVIRLFDTVTGDQISTLKGHQDLAVSIFFSSDNKSAISIALDGTARKWDVASGTPLGAVRFAPAPERAAKDVFRFPVDRQQVDALSKTFEWLDKINIAVLPDHTTLLVMHRGRAIQIMSLDRKSQVKELPIISTSTQPLLPDDLSRGSTQTHQANQDGTILKLNDGTLDHLIRNEGGRTTTLAEADWIRLSPSGQHYLVCSGSSVELRSTLDQKVLRSIETPCPNDIGNNSNNHFTPTGKYVVVKKDDTVLVFTAENGEPKSEIKIAESRWEFSPDGEKILFLIEHVGIIADVQLFNLSDGEAITLPPGMTENVDQVEFGPKGEDLAVTTASGSLKYNRLGSDAVITINPTSPVTSIAGLSGDGHFLITNHDDGIRRWALAGLNPLDVPLGSDSVSNVAFAAGGEHLLITDNEQIRVIDLDGGGVKTTVAVSDVSVAQEIVKGVTEPMKFYAHALSPDGSRMAIVAGPAIGRAHANGRILKLTDGSPAVQLQFPEPAPTLWSYSTKANFSGDGSRLLLSSDHEQWMFDAASGALISSFKADDITAVDLNHTGTRLLLKKYHSGGVETAELWDPSTGTFIAALGSTVSQDSDPVALNGGIVATLYTKGPQLALEEPGKPALKTIELPEDISSIEALPNGDGLLMVADKRRLVVGMPDLQTGAPLNADALALKDCFTLEFQRNATANYSDDKRVLFRQTDDNLSIAAHDLRTRACVAEMTGNQIPIKSIASGSTENVLAAILEPPGGTSRMFSIWKVGSLDRPVIIELKRTINNMALSPDGTTIAALLSDETVQLFNSDGQPLTSLRAPVAGSKQLRYSMDGMLLLVGGHSTIVALDAQDFAQRWTWQADMSLSDNYIREIDINTDGSWLKVERPLSFAIVDVRSGATVVETPVTADDSIDFSPDGKSVHAERNGVVVGAWKWSHEEFERIKTLKPPAQAINISSIHFAPDGASLAGLVDGALHIWEASSGTGRLFYKPGDEEISEYGFRHAGRKIRIVTSQGKARIIDASSAATETEITMFEQNSNTADSEELSSIDNTISYNNKGDAIAMAKSDSVTVWFKDGRTLRRKFNGDATKLVWSADDRLLAVAYAPSAISLWNVETNAAWPGLELDASRIERLFFSPTGKYIAVEAGGPRFAVRQTDLDSSTLLAKSCEVLPRRLSAEERQALFLDDTQDSPICGLQDVKLADQPNPRARSREPTASASAVTVTP